MLPQAYRAFNEPARSPGGSRPRPRICRACRHLRRGGATGRSHSRSRSPGTPEAHKLPAGNPHRSGQAYPAPVGTDENGHEDDDEDDYAPAGALSLAAVGRSSAGTPEVHRHPCRHDVAARDGGATTWEWGSERL